MQAIFIFEKNYPLIRGSLFPSHKINIIEIFFINKYTRPSIIEYNLFIITMD